MASPPEVHGDGRQRRDFTYIANVVDANLAACHTPEASVVYNIACGTRTELIELLEHIQRILGTNTESVHVNPRPGTSGIRSQTSAGRGEIWDMRRR